MEYHSSQACFNFITVSTEFGLTQQNRKLYSCLIRESVEIEREETFFFAGSGLYVYTKYIVLQGTTNHPSFMFDGGFYRAMAQYTEGMALPLSTLSAQWKLQVSEKLGLL